MKRKIIMSAVAVGAVATGAVWLMAQYRAVGDQLAQYDGLTLGHTRAEVRYRMGEPVSVYGRAEREAGLPAGWKLVYYLKPQDDPSENKVNALPRGRTADDFDEWSFDQRDPLRNVYKGTVEARFEKNRLHSIRCLDFRELDNFCKPVLGVKPGASEEEVRKRLGEPTSQVIDNNGIKTLTYSDLGLELLLERGKVYAIELNGEGTPSFWRTLQLVLRVGYLHQG